MNKKEIFKLYKKRVGLDYKCSCCEKDLSGNFAIVLYRPLKEKEKFNWVNICKKCFLGGNNE